MTYTVCSTDGEFIAVVSKEQRNRLIGCTDEGHAPRRDSAGNPIYGTRLIQAHKKRNNLYYALVDAAVIRAELKREISSTMPIAEDNRTVRRADFATDTKSGWYYELHLPHCFAYATTDASAKEHSARHFLRGKRQAHSSSTGLHLVSTTQSERFPLQAASNVVTLPKRDNVIPFPSVRTEHEPLPTAA